MGIKILGSGYCVPAAKLNNKQIESIVDTTDEWIFTRTGISNRYIATTEDTTDLAYGAAKGAI